MPDETTVKEPSKNETIQEKIGGDLVARMEDASTLFSEVADLFRSLPNKPGETDTYAKEIEFFEGKKEQCLKIAGWYDPKARQKAKADRLRRQLAQIEAELAKSGN